MKARIQKIINLLKKLYPNPQPFLHFRTPFESVVATILSAQCTDARVNIVTKPLFRAANTPEKMLALGEKKLMKLVKTTGFYRAKTKNILACAKMLMEKFGGAVPSTLEELQKLPGVGRKTASVVQCQSFGIPAFPVDRHVFRVANRLALSHASYDECRIKRMRPKTPDKTDIQLRKNIPKKLWIPLHIQLISHGRNFCRPNPKCPACPLLPYCPEGKQRTDDTHGGKNDKDRRNPPSHHQTSRHQNYIR